MSKNNEVITNGSAIAFVLDNQDYPPGDVKELNPTNNPTLFLVNYDVSDLANLKDMESISSTPIVEVMKKKLIDKTNALDSKERISTD